MTKEIIVALVCLIGSIILYSTLGAIEEERAVTFPRILIVSIGVLSALLLIQTALVKRKTGEAEGKEPYPIGRFLVLFGMIVLYIAVMESVGFYLSAFVFFIAVCFIFGRADLTLKKGGQWIAASAGFIAVLFILFKMVLQVQTPRGIFY